MFQRDRQLVGTGRCMMDSNAMDIRVVVQREPAKLTLQRLKKPFSFGMNVLGIKTSFMYERSWKGWKSI